MPNQNYASPFLRLLANLIDQLIGIIIFLLVLMPVFSALTTESILDSVLRAFITLFYIGIVLPFFYAHLTARLGGSPGKLITGLKVVSEEGSLISFQRSLFRMYVGYSVSWVFMGAGYFYAFIDPKRRGWHDLAIGTIVLRANSAGVILGILVFASLSFANLIFIKNIAAKVIQNKDAYSQIIEDVESELDSNKEGKELPFVPNDSATVTFVNSKYPFTFDYPLNYEAFDSTTNPDFIHITLEDQLDESFSKPLIMIKSEPATGPYPKYADDLLKSKCTDIGSSCMVPNTGSDYLMFESRSANINYFYSYIPNKNRDTVYGISMQAREENKEFTPREREVFQKTVDSFKFVDNY